MKRRRRQNAESWTFDGEHFVWPAGACMTAHQIAEVIGNSDQAVLQSEKRALAKMKEKLEQRGWDNNV